MILLVYELHLHDKEFYTLIFLIGGHGYFTAFYTSV